MLKMKETQFSQSIRETMGKTPITSDPILWAYRLFLDREPENASYASMAQKFETTAAIRKHFLASPEYMVKNPDIRTDVTNLKVFADLAHYGVPGLLFVNLSDGIGLSVARGDYEPAEITFMKSLLQPGRTVVDIGANIGAFTVIASHLVGEQGKVFSFEPIPDNISSLQRSLAANPICKNVSLSRTIVADGPRDDVEIAWQDLQTQDLSSPLSHTGGAYIVTKDQPIPEGLSRMSAEVDALDNLIPENVKVDFIKIDIEGAEPLAMRGAERILITQSPVIMSEVHTDQLKSVSKTDWKGYFEKMAALGYRPRNLDGSELGELEDGNVYNVAFIKG